MATQAVLRSSCSMHRAATWHRIQPTKPLRLAQPFLAGAPLLRHPLRSAFSVAPPARVPRQHLNASAALRSNAPEHDQQQHTDAPSPLRQLAFTVLKTAAVSTFALALAFSSVSPADAARSGGRMGGRSFSSKSYSSSRSSSGPSTSYRGSTLAPAPSLSYGGGYSSVFVPWGFGYGFGYGVPGGGFGFMSVFFWMFFAVVALQVAKSFFWDGGVSYGEERVAVAKLQVGLLGSARELQRDLERIALTADTDGPEGLAYVLQETVLSLARNPDYAVYGFGQVDSALDMDAGEAAFNEVVMEERTKFKEETLVNVGGVSRRKAAKLSSSGPNDLIVVTIIVCCDGTLKLPPITDRTALRTALNRLGAVPADNLLACEVMWTPQDENDFYTRDEIIMDYPYLNTL